MASFLSMKRAPVRFFLATFGLPAVPTSLWLHFGLGFSWLGSWFTAINVAAFLLWGFDKWRAIRKGWRVPEMTLHAFSVLGAVPAAFLAMSLFRHKTLKLHFAILYGAVLVFQIAVWITLSSGSSR